MTTAQYSDLDLNFIEHPGLKNILPKTEIEAVKRSVRNLFYLSYGDKPFHPERAIGIKKYLFEQMTPIVFAKMRREIVQLLQQFEPRVDVLDITFDAPNNQGRLNMTLTIRIINIPDIVTIPLYLDRQR